MISKKSISSFAKRFQNNKLVRVLIGPIWRRYYHIERKKQIKNFLHNGVTLLKEINSLCSREGIKIWLEFGTLLGAYRENDFIKHDYDIDMGAFFKDKEKLEECLLSNGFELLREFRIIEDGKMVGAEQTYSYKAVMIDIFYFHILGEDKIKLNSFTPIFDDKKYEGRAEIRERIMPYSGLKKILFKGIECYIPKNTSLYLSKYYGENFMIPDPNYDYRKVKSNIKYIDREVQTAEYEVRKKLYI
ncbi:MAG: LicD family protein [Muribaculaceae bacterium]|nr:LicD family protein [Muribaculaceae bacterium]